MRRLDFLYHSDLSPRVVSVYTYLADRAGKNDQCWPAIPTIAKDLKLSQSTVRRALDDLRKAGLVETKQRYRKTGGKSSLCGLFGTNTIPQRTGTRKNGMWF